MGPPPLWPSSIASPEPWTPVRVPGGRRYRERRPEQEDRAHTDLCKGSSPLIDPAPRAVCKGQGDTEEPPTASKCKSPYNLLVAGAPGLTASHQLQLRQPRSGGDLGEISDVIFSFHRKRHPLHTALACTAAHVSGHRPLSRRAIPGSLKSMGSSSQKTLDHTAAGQPGK